jgi:antitoxin VapB
MTHIAKIFTNGRSQAVRLPAAYKFDTKEVFIYRDEQTGNVILSCKPKNWDDFFIALRDANVPPDFLDEDERKQRGNDYDPFKEWQE